VLSRRSDDLFHKLGVTRCTQTNVVWKQRRTHHIVVTVNGICPPDDGYTRAAFCGVYRRFIVSISKIDPLLYRRVFVFLRK
jgi:hypothetical protein